MKSRKSHYRWCHKNLTKQAKVAKSYVLRICDLLSKLGNRKFTVDMSARFNIYEGHIIDHGKCVWNGDDCSLSDSGTEEVGTIFFGGYFSRKRHKNAMSLAWISLLDDCIGASELDNFNLTCYLKHGFGPKIDLNCKTISALDVILKEHGV